jgi:hypothetical protein
VDDVIDPQKPKQRLLSQETVSVEFDQIVLAAGASVVFDWAIWLLPLYHHQNPYGGARVALGTSVGAIEAISDLEE